MRDIYMKKENLRQRSLLNKLYKNKKELIKIHENDFKQISTEILLYQKKEPWKILRRSHKKWMNKLNNLNSISEKYYIQLSKDYQDLEHLIDLSQMLK